MLQSPQPNPRYRLYTLPECSACEKAEQFFKDRELDFVKVVMDDPLMKLGCEAIFSSVYAPWVLEDDSKVYVFNKEFSELLKVKI